tara:strand:- start:19857 stop:20606 length:750 start_codon:yes stop_codon:yes gene_type:complete
MSHERFESLDIFWKGTKSTFSPKICYIYVQGEYGFIPYIVGSSVESGKKPIAEIVSKNMSIDPFNRMPNMVKPCWSITQVSSNTCFININNFHAIKMMPDSNPDVWEKSYPLMMDLLLFLKQNGCSQINFITSMNAGEADVESDLLIYDMHNEIRPEQDLLLSLPAWAMPHLWREMGGKSCVVCVIQDEGQYIDKQAFDLLEDYIVALGLPYDKVHRDRLSQVLLSVRENIETLGHSFDIFGDDGGDWA